MTYIKRLVMKGFKSFARETTMEMDRHVNVVVGPNGSGKSNVTDALCFVLGRLSIKSMRAAKASHLIFSGNKDYKGANEAYVELVFDNSDKVFALEKEEIIIRRIVKKNGQSVYRINNETKTRQEVLELLAQGGIDPHGFNIILQGEIEKFVKMPAEDRKKVIEEVAGISVYEMRKQKSLRELERTDEKLRQISAVLRERTNYMKNLESEREQALKFKKLEETVKKCKASILCKSIEEKEKELKQVLEKIQAKEKDAEKKQAGIDKTQEEVKTLTQKAETITKTIQKSSGLEQDSLNKEISELRQEIAGMLARKENFESQLNELERRKQTLTSTIKDSEYDINELSKEKGKNNKKELDEKKKKLDELEKTKRDFYLLKSNLSSVNSQIEDKKRQIQSLKNNSEFTVNQMEQLEKEIRIKDSLSDHQEKLIKLNTALQKNKEEIPQLESVLIENEKQMATSSYAIREAENVKSDVSKLDVCPLCRTKITPEHISHVVKKSDEDIQKATKIITESQEIIKQTKLKLAQTKDLIAKISIEINTRNVDVVKIQSIEDKKQEMKRNFLTVKEIEKELKDLDIKKKTFENKISTIKVGDEQYETLKLEINELSRSEERNLGFEITSKQRELERIKIALKQIDKDKEDIMGDLGEMKESLEKKQSIAVEKEDDAEILKKKYQKMYEEKNSLQDKARFFESHLLKQENDKRLFENEINNFKIEKAQITAKKETLEQDYAQFKDVEIISMAIDKLKEKQFQAESTLAHIGSVNLRALEVYDGIKAEYDKIKEKVDQLEKEKQEIILVIEKIDRKKKKVFVGTLNDVNALFSRNFSQLSTKGVVSLEPQDKKDVLEEGLSITVKVGPGKYFDVTSLSGGEQTLVALSLIFAIQEFKPYCFYIFDEIDAALDRRNSEKLAYLLKRYMKEGQYLIITHNDSLISESSNNLYGITMQEGISKILSLEV